jgi:hypothetical protein
LLSSNSDPKIGAELNGVLESMTRKSKAVAKVKVGEVIMLVPMIAPISVRGELT